MLGLDVRDGVHALVADDPAAFAGHVVRLLDDRDLAGRVAEAGRALVEQRYSWDRVAAPFVAEVMESGSVPRSGGKNAGADAGPATKVMR
jgi:glycosyltransferase involved in cell wall biosynthesis